ncbi:MAG: biopolymer transporter ExbD [Syntrophorhabdales bacterium]|jgi:biopolymer transport protein ExbD
MRLSRRSRKKARIEIIPMIDTMFFLLVFFMVATLSMTMERGIPVNLPHAATARDELRQVVSLTLTKEGKLFVDKEEVASPEEAALRLVRRKTTGAEISVVINADRVVEHGRVVDLLDEVRQSGITRIAIGERPRDAQKN